MIACGCFARNGRPCENDAIVVVTLRGVAGRPDDRVPTCATDLPRWHPDVVATARPIESER